MRYRRDIGHGGPRLRSSEDVPGPFPEIVNEAPAGGRAGASCFPGQGIGIGALDARCDTPLRRKMCDLRRCHWPFAGLMGERGRAALNGLGSRLRGPTVPGMPRYRVGPPLQLSRMLRAASGMAKSGLDRLDIEPPAAPIASSGQAGLPLINAAHPGPDVEGEATARPGSHRPVLHC